MRCVNLHIWIQEILSNIFNFMELSMSPTFKQFWQFKTYHAEKKIILSTIRCKKNEGLPQAGNDETENVQKHACEAKGGGLQYKNTLSNKSCQHGRRKSTHQ